MPDEKDLETPENGDDNGNNGSDDKKDKTWDTILEGLSDEDREFYEGHISGLKSALVAERTAAKDGRKAIKRLEELEKERADREKAEMDEVDRLKLENDEYKTRLKGVLEELALERRNNAITAAASQLDFADPADAITLADLSSIEYDEDKDNWKGIDDALKALLKQKPYLKVAPEKRGHGTPTRDAEKKSSDGKVEQPRVSF